MHKIYVAGPYSADSICTGLTNMKHGIRKATELMLRGYAPFCPWLDYHFTLMTRENETITLEQYYAYSIAFLEVCDAVLLLPGWENSKGTVAEVELAKKIGIPVFLPEEECLLDDYFAIPGSKKELADLIAEGEE